MLTSPHVEVSGPKLKLTDSFDVAVQPVQTLYNQLTKVIKEFEDKKILYDYIVCVEDQNHIHAYLEFVQPVNLAGYIDILAMWNMRIVPEEDKQIEGVKGYVRKSGYWIQKVDELPSVYSGDPEWRPWQREVIDRLDGQNDRQILYVYDQYGNKGKSFLASWLSCRRRASYLPATLKGARDLLRVALDRPSSCYFVDFPKCVTMSNIPQVFAAVESIKNGHVYDDRYEYRDLFMDHPKVCVFGNFQPDKSMLSKDRWDIKWL